MVDTCPVLVEIRVGDDSDPGPHYWQRWLEFDRHALPLVGDTVVEPDSEVTFRVLERAWIPSGDGIAGRALRLRGHGWLRRVVPAWSLEDHEWKQKMWYP